MYTLSIWNGRLKLFHNFHKIGCSLSFDSLAKSAMGLSAPATFYSSKSQSIKRQLSLSQTLHSSRRSPPSRPAHSLFTPRDTERPWEGHIHTIIQWPSTFDAVKTAVHWSPIEVDGRWASTGKCTVMLRECMRGKSSQSTCNKQVWTNSSSRWMCSNAFLVNEMLTQYTGM